MFAYKTLPKMALPGLTFGEKKGENHVLKNI